MAIGVLGLVVAIALYFAGVRQGKHQEKGRREHDLALERLRREHEFQMEESRRHHERVEKVVGEFVELGRKSIDGGPHALATLGLHQLGSDEAIREAIGQMQLRTSADPWSGYSEHVQGVDLVRFSGTYRRIA